MEGMEWNATWTCISYGDCAVQKVRRRHLSLLSLSLCAVGSRHGKTAAAELAKGADVQMCRCVDVEMWK